jgi:peptidoglycan/LPS O-acetylase OafA/YrhL
MNWVEALNRQPPFGLLDHTWSLSIEEQFYLLWPLGLLLAYRLGRGRGVFVAAVGGAVLSAGLRALLWHTGQPVHRVYYGLDTHADGLLLGCALAAATLYRPRPVRDLIRRSPGQVAGPIALVLLGLAASQTALFSKGLPGWGYPAIGVLTAIVIADIWAGGALDRVLRPAPLVAVGRISYGLYLWHWPVFLVLNETRTHWSGPPLTLVRLAVTFAVAVASFFAIEQPFLRLKKRFEPAGRLSEPTFDPQPTTPNW